VLCYINNVTLLFTFVNALNDFSFPNTCVVGAANHLWCFYSDLHAPKYYTDFNA